jgi:hypothetical protein
MEGGVEIKNCCIPNLMGLSGQNHALTALHYQLDRRLCGYQSSSGCSDKKNTLLAWDQWQSSRLYPVTFLAELLQHINIHHNYFVT